MSKVQYIDIHSDALDKLMAFSIYLPDGYDGERIFPVLYFLHGRSGDESIIDRLDIKSAADELIVSGQISPMMIVCPRMDNSRGLNTAVTPHQAVVDGMKIDTGLYEDYFIHEVIPYIDRHFMTIPHREHRFVGGASAGGFAAAHYGLQYPGLFSRVGGDTCRPSKRNLTYRICRIMGMKTAFIKAIRWSLTALKNNIGSRCGILMQVTKTKEDSTTPSNPYPED